MATANGRESSGLSDRLFREPYRFDFFQAVRMLEHLARERAAEDPKTASSPVGHDRPPEAEVVRFRSLPSLSFPASAIAHVRRLSATEGTTARAVPFAELMVTFMGVTGPMGVLPHHYTALLLRRMRDKDFSLRDFLDMFHHRAIALFFRAWVKYRLPFAYERSKLDAMAREDLITWGLYCLAGFGTAGLRGRLEIDDEAVLYYGGHFAHFPRSSVALESILADYFDLPVRVLPIQGQWLQLAPADQALMPCPDHPKGLNNQLGVNLVAGERVWDIQSKFRIQLGPLTYAQFQRFMPNGDALRSLCQLTRTYVGAEFDFDIQLVLRPDAVPWCQLDGGGEHKPCLGWNTWGRAAPFTRPVGDAVFFLEEI
jgi:type VI secretion system protein ImpH